MDKIVNITNLKKNNEMQPITSPPVEFPQRRPLCPGLPVEEFNDVVSGRAANDEDAAVAADGHNGATVLDLK